MAKRTHKYLGYSIPIRKLGKRTQYMKYDLRGKTQWTYLRPSSWGKMSWNRSKDKYARSVGASSGRRVKNPASRQRARQAKHEGGYRSDKLASAIAEGFAVTKKQEKMFNEIDTAISDMKKARAAFYSAFWTALKLTPNEGLAKVLEEKVEFSLNLNMQPGEILRAFGMRKYKKYWLFGDDISPLGTDAVKTLAPLLLTYGQSKKKVQILSGKGVDPRSGYAGMTVARVNASPYNNPYVPAEDWANVISQFGELNLSGPVSYSNMLNRIQLAKNLSETAGPADVNND